MKLKIDAKEKLLRAMEEEKESCKETNCDQEHHIKSLEERVRERDEELETFRLKHHEEINSFHMQL